MRAIPPVLRRLLLLAFFAAALADMILSAGLLAGEKSATCRAAIHSIRSDELKQFVDRLASDAYEGREAGSRGGHAAAEYLIARLTRLGLHGAGHDGGFAQPFAPNYRNVLAALPGSDARARDEVIVACAHYDHVGYGRPGTSLGAIGQIHNGADDNASGVSGLLELAEAFRLLPQAPRRTILFAFWDAEEIGMQGARHWLAHPTLSGRVVFLVNMDMIGRLRQRLIVHGTRTGHGLRRLVTAHNVDNALTVDFPWSLVRNADHAPFFEQGVPVLLFHTGLHDEYHRATDDASLIDTEGIGKIARLMFGVIHDVADSEQSPAFRPEAKYETDESRRGLEEQWPPLPDRPLRVGITWAMDDAEPGTATVARIAPGSPAARAGLQPGDRILQVAGRDFRDDSELAALLKSLPGPIPLLVERDGRLRMAAIRFETQAKPPAA